MSNRAEQEEMQWRIFCIRVASAPESRRRIYMAVWESMIARQSRREGVS